MLADEIRAQEANIRERLFVGFADLDALLLRLEETEQGRIAATDEQVWTLLLACCFAQSSEGPSSLASALTGDKTLVSRKIWFEVLPRSPRSREGATHLDLALGDLSRRSDTASGIELAPDGGNVVFCEFKWRSDISYSVSYDDHRNQLARVIDNAISIRSASGDLPRRAHVALVSPTIFLERRPRSRLYGYKFDEYSASMDALKSDLESSSLQEVKNDRSIEERLRSLQLHWRGYEQLIDAAPPSQLRTRTLALLESYGMSGKAG